MDAAPTLGLYLHIPFCKHKCIYCDFYSLAGNEPRMEEYTNALCAHLTATAPQAAGHTVDTVYFGGGTPSYLGVERLCRILGVIFDRYTVSADAEITFEANPDSACDVNALAALRKAGFNRISLGMQSADDGELATIGRIHTHTQTGAAVAAARAAGFDNLSLDLIYGLPQQTMERWQANLAAAAELQPQHLSCYGLKVEEGTPLYARRDSVALPDDDAQADFYLRTVEFLSAQGYEQYEVSNFSKAGHESRHNLKYWVLGEYLGFGPGAHSDFGGERFAWSRDLSAYIRGVQTGDIPLSEQEAVTPLQRESEWLMLNLRTAGGIAPAAYEHRFDRSFAAYTPFLEQCRRAGYVLFENDRWHLTPHGFLLSNQIIGGLLGLLETQAE